MDFITLVYEIKITYYIYLVYRIHTHHIMKYSSCKYPSKKQNICINYTTWYKKKCKYHWRDGWKWINALYVLCNKIISLYKPVAAVIQAAVAAVSARRDRSGKTRWADWSIPFTSLVGGGGGVWSSPEHGKRSFSRVRKPVAPLLFHVVIISARLYASRTDGSGHRRLPSRKLYVRWYIASTKPLI